MKKIIFTLVFVFGFLLVKSQVSYSVSGSLSDAVTQNPLEYASIQITQKNGDYTRSFTSGLDGRFEFQQVPEGIFLLQIQCFTYEDLQIDSLIVDKQTDLGMIKLTPGNNVLNETKVYADKNSVVFQADKQIIQVDGQIYAQGGTVADALQIIPSVQVDAEGNVKLRGSEDFLLLIDDRPSLLPAKDVLSQMQASSVDRIEVITNPSAKYQSQGNTGIINIITKKVPSKSTEGLIDLSVANGNKYSAGLLFGISKRKIKYFGGLNYSDKVKVNESWSERILLGTNELQESFYATRRIRKYLADFKIGADIRLNDNNNLTIESQAGNWNFDREIDSRVGSEIYTEDYVTSEFFSNKNRYLQTGLNYSHSFSKQGTKLSVDGYWKYVENKTTNDYQENSDFFLQYIDNQSQRSDVRCKADFVLPLSESKKIESGIFFSREQSEYTYSLEYPGITDSSLMIVPASETAMTYQNTLTASYVQYQGNLGKLEIQSGIRAELNNQSLNTLENRYIDKKNQLDFFPTLNLSFALSKKTQMLASYSRRINRPDEWHISPLIYSLDRFSQKIGNPELKDEYTNAVELGLMTKTESAGVQFQFFLKDIQSPVHSVMVNKDSSFLESYINLDKDVQSGLELMISYQPFKWLKLNTGWNSYYSQWSGTFQDMQLNNSALKIYGNFRASFIFSKSTYLQFLTVYYAPSDEPQGHTDAFCYYDFILRHQLLDKKLSLTLRTHNTFNTGLLRYEVKGQEFVSKNRYLYEGPTFILSLSYKINNFKKRRSENIEVDFDSGLDH